MSLSAKFINVALLTLAFAGLGHALYLAAGQALLPERRPRNSLIAWLYLGVALIFLDVLLLVGAPPALFDALPALSFWLTLWRFFLGPLAFAYFGFMISSADSTTFTRRPAPDADIASEISQPTDDARRRWRHLMPGLLLLTGGTALLLADLALLIFGEACGLCRGVQDALTLRISRALLIAAGNLHIVLYLLPGIYAAARLLRRGQQKPAALAAALLGTGALAAATLQAASGIPQLVGGGEVQPTTSTGGAGLAGISLLLLALYAVGLLGQRFPRFLESLRLEARRMGRRRENRLRNLSEDQLQRSLDELMQTEKIYRDEDLRLSTVAALLDVTPHQLSYYLNQVLQIDFAAFINQHRVRAVQADLRSPEKYSQSVLEIGFAAGFNSKTAFYRAFGEVTGMSPSRYRERFRSDES